REYHVPEVHCVRDEWGEPEVRQLVRRLESVPDVDRHVPFGVGAGDIDLCVKRHDPDLPHWNQLTAARIANTTQIASRSYWPPIAALTVQRASPANWKMNDGRQRRPMPTRPIMSRTLPIQPMAPITLRGPER